jgi:hypothetical protein
MPIVINKLGDHYEAEVTPPHGRGRVWQSSHPENVDVLIAKLLNIGCHQTDIGDAFYAADPEWLSRGDEDASQPE